MHINECFGKRVTSEEKKTFEGFIKNNPVASIGYLNRFGYPPSQIAKIVDINEDKVRELESKSPETRDVPSDLWRYASQKSGFPEVRCMVKVLKK